MQGLLLLPAYTFIYPFLNFRHTELDRLCDFFSLSANHLFYKSQSSYFQKTEEGVKTCLRFSHPLLIYSSDLAEASYTAGFQMRWLYLPSTAARIHPKISQEITSPIPTVSIMSGIGSITPYA